MPDRRPLVVIMVRAPVAGRVKTRLGRDIGPVGAAWWYRHQTRRIIRRLADPAWRIVLATAPDDIGGHRRQWTAAALTMPQGTGHLGARMRRIMVACAPRRTVIIGSDVPGIERADLRAAFAALAGADAVLGPSPDGGYWLIGLAPRIARQGGLLDGVRRSSRHALADTLGAIAPARVRLLRQLADVDRALDLKG